MKSMALLFAFLAVAIAPSGNAQDAPRRAIQCKTPAIAKSCYWTRGRLWMANGNPSFRLWKIGTHRILGIYSGPSADQWSLDNEAPEFPANVSRDLRARVHSAWSNTLFADFEVCPLAPLRPGVMQPACIEAAKNIVIEK